MPVKPVTLRASTQMPCVVPRPVSVRATCQRAGGAGIRSIIIFIMVCIISMRFSII